jgi:hypothetical protein
MSPPTNAKAALAACGSAKTTEEELRPLRNTAARRSEQTHCVIATIDKGRSSQLRVGITSWRGQNKLELREATATVPGVYMPTPNGVTLDLDRLPELLDALHAAESEAIARGFLSLRDAA